jgi:hypothetical protein
VAVSLGAAVENGMGPEGHPDHPGLAFSEPEAPLPAIASGDGSAAGPCDWAVVRHRGREGAGRGDLQAGPVVSQHPASAGQSRSAWNPQASRSPAWTTVSLVST